MGLLDLLQQVADGNADAHFDQVVQSASTDQLGEGLAAAMRSDETPPFAQMVGQFFGQSSASQQAGVLNQILAVLGPAALSAVADGVLGRMLAPGQVQLTPDQASRLSPEQVTEIAAHAEQMHPALIDQLGRFYAQHAGLIKTVGGAALAVMLAKMKEHAAQR